MQTRVMTGAAIRTLPDDWGLVLSSIGSHWRAWMTTVEMGSPDRRGMRAGKLPIDASCCPAMEAAGWLARWELAGPAPDAGDDGPPPGVTAWTLTPWAAETLGLELDEIGCDGAPARWLEIKYDERGERLAIDRPIIAPWHRWERLQPWIERLSEDRRKALMGGEKSGAETMRDEESGEEIRLFAGPDGKGKGVAIVREMKKLGKASRGKGKGKKGRRAG